jgi:hypothetical protein
MKGPADSFSELLKEVDIWVRKVLIIDYFDGLEEIIHDYRGDIEFVLSKDAGNQTFDICITSNPDADYARWTPQVKRYFLLCGMDDYTDWKSEFRRRIKAMLWPDDDRLWTRAEKLIWTGPNLVLSKKHEKILRQVWRRNEDLVPYRCSPLEASKLRQKQWYLTDKFMEDYATCLEKLGDDIEVWGWKLGDKLVLADILYRYSPSTLYCFLTARDPDPELNRRSLGEFGFSNMYKNHPDIKVFVLTCEEYAYVNRWGPKRYINPLPKAEYLYHDTCPCHELCKETKHICFQCGSEFRPEDICPVCNYAKCPSCLHCQCNMNQCCRDTLDMIYHSYCVNGDRIGKPIAMIPEKECCKRVKNAMEETLKQCATILSQPDPRT